ncbi:MAG TPA: hypothetical protein DCE55_29390 [Planctomycetaceae bacterium]|nr:hypothetical protein [Planctomycetaceae bacterium]|tara:strand:- start:470 stop:3541 length:3072 start_codon:yes stop_codon:yes gene_type:complete
MATVTKSIGTSSRDYSTITLWEADLDDDTPYDAGDDAVGECYNDSVFDETVTINGGGTVGLDAISLTVAAGERHDGTAGTGARNIRSSASSNNFVIDNSNRTVNISWLEISNNGTGSISSGQKFGIKAGQDDQGHISNVIAHGIPGSTHSTRPGTGIKVHGSRTDFDITNCIVYDCGGEQGGTGTDIAGGDGIISTNHGGGHVMSNNTVHGIIQSSGANGDGITADDTGFTVKNCVAADCGGSDFAGTPNSASDYNASSDATAFDNGNSLTSITTADQFVSTAGGSEDLHLKAGADCIAAGDDLGTANDANIDINGSNRDAFAATTWDMGAHQYEIVASIGTASRDYSTITLWEADWDDTTKYGATARIKGECYNDSVFDERCTLNGGVTSAIDYATLSVASSERHDGTAGSGARIVMSANWSTGILYQVGMLRGPLITVEWLELNGGGFKDTQTSGSVIQMTSANNIYAGPQHLKNCIIHNADGNDKHMYVVYVSSAHTKREVLNTIIYDCSVASGGRSINGVYLAQAFQRDVHVRNVTVHALTNNTTGSSIGLKMTDDAQLFVQNVMATDVDLGTTTGTEACFNPSSLSNATVNNNLSSDATASGTGSLTSKASSNQYVSTTGGSEDLHLKAGADAINAGSDLGTEHGVQFDIDGRDRDTEGDTWDIGADEFVSTGITVSLSPINMHWDPQSLTTDMSHSLGTVPLHWSPQSPTTDIAHALGTVAVHVDPQTPTTDISHALGTVPLHWSPQAPTCDFSTSLPTVPVHWGPQAPTTDISHALGTVAVHVDPQTPTTDISHALGSVNVHWDPQAPTTDLSTSLPTVPVHWDPQGVTTDITHALGTVPVHWSPQAISTGGVTTTPPIVDMLWSPQSTTTDLSASLPTIPLHWSPQAPTSDLNHSLSNVNLHWSPQSPTTGMQIDAPSAVAVHVDPQAPSQTAIAATPTPVPVHWSPQDPTTAMQLAISAVPIHWTAQVVTIADERFWTIHTTVMYPGSVNTTVFHPGAQHTDVHVPGSTKTRIL